MTQEELNMALFDKMDNEMQTYTDYLKTLSPSEILNQCREYITKFDILSVMETTDLPADQARALLAANSPLDAVYLHYDTKEVNYLDGISDAIIEKSAALLDEYQVATKTPVYYHSLSHAQTNGTVDAYIASHKLNIACKEDIDSAIKDFYTNGSLDDEAARRIVEKYGISRTILVLVNTMQHEPSDTCFSPENRSWADFISYPRDPDMDGEHLRLDYVAKSHPDLINLFVTSFRKQYSQQERQERPPQKVKPSIRERIKAPVPKKNSPKISANKKGVER